MTDLPSILKESDPRECAQQSSLLDIPVRRAVFYLAWPTIIAVLLENIATTIDMIMVGRLGAAEIASVGFSSMIYWLLSSLVIGIEVSVTAIVARHIGAGRTKEARLGLGQALILALAVSAILGILTFILAPLIFRLFGVEPDVYRFSVSYLRILCAGMLFLAIIAVFSGALRGAGDTRTPMFIGVVGTITNISLSYLLIFGKFGLPALGPNGAAIGTIISFFTASIIYLFLFFTGRLKLRISWQDFKWDSRRARQIIHVALPAASEQVVLELGLLIYAKFIVAFGTLALSGYQVGMQVLSLAFIPNVAFSMAAATIIGQNLGAGRKKEAKKAGWVCLRWAMLAMCLLGVIYLIASRQLASIFVKDPQVIEIASSFIQVVGICQAGMAIYFTLAGALRGAGDTRSPLLITLLGMYGLRIPGVWITTGLLGMGIKVAFSLLIFDYIIRVVAILFRYGRGKWLETRM